METRASLTMPYDSTRRRGHGSLRRRLPAALLAIAVVLGTATCSPPAPQSSSTAIELNIREYPWHTDILATTFWVGEVVHPKAEDGSQSTYDSKWIQSYGGCDGTASPACRSETRTASNGYAPTTVTARENPFYLGLPYDDINDEAAFKERATVIPWANDSGYAGKSTDRSFSYMKNRWVRIRKDGRECYGQIEDAGPGKYPDKAYVFSNDDARPVTKTYKGAGMNVSPALNGCLNFKEPDGDGDRIDWQFIDDSAVPDGPWKSLITTSQVQ
jgi:hypothetical protein